MGTLVIQEKQQPEGYKLNPDKFIVNITPTDVVIRDASGNVLGSQVVRAGNEIADTRLNVKDELIRMDLAFVKVDVNGAPMANIPFAISLLDENGNPTETHVIVTDDNGFASTAGRAKDARANSLDSYMNKGRFTDDSALDDSVNVWFGLGDPEEGRGSLIPGVYRIEELQCAANQGQSMLKQTIDTDPYVDGKLYLAGNVFVDIDIETESVLIDKASQGKSATFGTAAEFTDTVKFNHLRADEAYRAETEIIYEDREGAKTSVGITDTAFTASSAKQTVENTVAVDTSVMKGGKLHAIDRLYMNWRGEEILIATHNTDFTEETQTVYIPYMYTQAADVSTEDHVGAATKTAKISDLIYYEGLADSKIYHAKGVLRYADTGEIVKDASGADCTVDRILRVSYNASDVTERALGIYVGPKDGVLPMPYFELDTTAMQGRTIVVTETLYDYDSGEPILEHEDLLDEKQSVHIPKVTTTAEDSKTNTHTGTVGTTEKVIDHVVMENLIIGQTYEVGGTLVYKEDCTDASGKAHKAGDVIATHPKVTVEATDTTMTVDITFEVDSTALEGVSGVVFEDLYHNGILVAPHHDLDSKEQTVNWPKVRTTAQDDLSKTHTGVARADAKIIDTVSLTNLTVGEKYRVDGVLMDKATGKAFVDAAGNTIRVSSDVFTAASRNMTKELVFDFDATDLEDTAVVVFEKLICLSGTDDAGEPEEPKETEVASHEDLTDEGQTIHFPEAHTNATESNTHDHVGTVSETAVIEDLVSYKNLVAGEEYTVKGTLHYKEDGTDAAGKSYKAGDEVKDKNGKPYTGETTFVPEASDGTVTVTFKVNSEILRGKSVVVFENVYQGDIEVYAHADIEDENQTVEYPDVKTKAKDLTTGEQQGYSGPTQIEDVVKLSNLIPGQTYDVSGVLMDKETRLPVLDANGNEIRAEKKGITATAANMEVTLVFDLDAKIIAGRTCVVFEDLLHNGVVAAAHADIEDKDQTVSYPSIRTTAVDKGTGTHVAVKNGIVTVLDTVTYTNLKPGTYVMRGTLMVKETGLPMKDQDGKDLVTELRFEVTEENMSGEVVLPFEFDTARLTGTDVVVFEKLFKVVTGSENEGETPEETLVPVADHEDMNDEGQTVTYNPPKPPVFRAPKTGDPNNWKTWAMLLAVAMLGMISCVVTIRKKSHK